MKKCIFLYKNGKATRSWWHIEGKEKAYDTLETVARHYPKNQYTLEVFDVSKSPYEHLYTMSVSNLKGKDL